MASSLTSRNVFSSGSVSARAGLIALIVFVCFVAVSVIILLIFKQYKRRQYESLPQKNPYITSTAEFNMKPRKMSQDDLEEHAELQRQVMIRKSLASRTSFRVEEQRSLSNDNSDDEDSRPASLMSDWKEYEAGVKRERSATLENHPSLKHPSQRTNDDSYAYGRRVPSPALSELSRTMSPRPSSLRNTITAPPPAVSSPTPPPYSRLVRSTIQVPPPRRATFDYTKTVAPRRATFDSVKPTPRRGTFDTVPEEYNSVPLAEMPAGKGYNWI